MAQLVWLTMLAGEQISAHYRIQSLLDGDITKLEDLSGIPMSLVGVEMLMLRCIIDDILTQVRATISTEGVD